MGGIPCEVVATVEVSEGGWIAQGKGSRAGGGIQAEAENGAAGV